MTRLTPVHPGEILREDFMKPLSLSANALAALLGVPANRISRLTSERSGITADTAMRLARIFNMTPDFWMNAQKGYELDMARASGPLSKAIAAIEPIEITA